MTCDQKKNLTEMLVRLQYLGEAAESLDLHLGLSDLSTAGSNNAGTV